MDQLSSTIAGEICLSKDPGSSMKKWREIFGVSQTELAKSVGQKVDVYSSTVAATSPEISQEVLGEVEDILQETKDQVVEVIITAHEQEQDVESARELDATFEKEVASIQLQYGSVSESSIETAQALRLEGSYRRAFQVLKEFVYSQETVPQETTVTTEE